VPGVFHPGLHGHKTSGASSTRLCPTTALTTTGRGGKSFRPYKRWWHRQDWIGFQIEAAMITARISIVQGLNNIG